MASELRNRAAGQTGTDVEKAKSLTTQIKTMESQFALAMPKGAEAAQLVRDAITCLRQNPKLAECEPASIMGGLMTLAQLGLRPGVLGQGWLIPFWDSKSRGFKATVVIGYQGMKDLAYRSNQIGGIVARTVFANDTFDVEYGTTDRLYHKPLMTGDRGEPIGYYCVCHIKDGRPIFVWMSHSDMEKHRDTYAMAKNKDGKIFGPWVDQFEGMAHKTCLRQLSKWMPMSTELQTALSVDDGVRVDLNPQASPEDVTVRYEQVPNDPPADDQSNSAGGDQ